MRFIDRLVSFCLALFAAVTALLLIFIAVGWNAAPVVADALFTMSTRAWETGLSALVLLLAALHLLSASIPRRTERAIVRETTLGQIRVSLRAIENVVYRSVKLVKGIRDVDTQIIPTSSGVDIRVCVAVLPDLVIPDLANEVQQSVERYVQETVGIPVGSVMVEVKSVTGAAKARVE